MLKALPQAAQQSVRGRLYPFDRIRLSDLHAVGSVVNGSLQAPTKTQPPRRRPLRSIRRTHRIERGSAKPRQVNAEQELHVLALNSGSSSLKFVSIAYALYTPND